MQDRNKRIAAQRRSRHAALASRFDMPVPRRAGGDGARRRRGALASENALWRRCETGTNHIASFGVWRRGTRRQAERLNRSGITRWHMPHRGGVRIVLPGALSDVVNQD